MKDMRLIGCRASTRIIGQLGRYFRCPKCIEQLGLRRGGRCNLLQDGRTDFPGIKGRSEAAILFEMLAHRWSAIDWIIAGRPSGVAGGLQKAAIAARRSAEDFGPRDSDIDHLGAATVARDANAGRVDEALRRKVVYRVH